MYLACSTLICKKDRFPDISDALTQIRELGFSAVDLAAFEKWQNVNPSELAADGGLAASIARLVRDSGLKVCSINAGLSRQLNDPDPGALETVKREFAAVLDLAYKTDSPNITLQPGKLPAPGTLKGTCVLEETTAVCINSLKVISCLSKGSGITISLEGHHGSILEKPEQSLKLMEELWPDFGLTYDPSHYVMRDMRFEDTASLLDYTYHVHLRNASSGRMQAAMKEGSTDFRKLVDTLKRKGYKGALSVEYFNGFDASFENTRLLKGLLEGLL